MNKEKIDLVPDFLQPFLWSCDLAQLDSQKHKNIIIKNVLDYGNKKATDWLRKKYQKKEIGQAIK